MGQAEGAVTSAEAFQVPGRRPAIDPRVLRISALAIVLGIVATGIALLLMVLIAFVTNLAFFGRVSIAPVAPATAVSHLGLWVIPIPVLGGIVVGLMARYGSAAIRGHGIPEAMEQILTNKSRIPAKVTLLKPLSSAVAIGTGGPFGAEGPIIATGGALGSLVGQITACSPAERKTLLAAGAAAGMAAIFGSPVSAVLLAIELLLFEYRPRSIIPVALAATTAAGLRIAIEGPGAAFPMSALGPPPLAALAFYVALGALMGAASAGVTRLVYGIEDWFERLPIHWMWWPALGAVVVGAVGYVAPDTLGVGYYNITAILDNDFPLKAVALLCTMKFVSWAIALGSGTSGGTLAPLFTIGGGFGALIGGAMTVLAPGAGVDIRLAGLIGMATLFAGASRAMIASAIFAFETTQQPMALLPLLGGCAAAYLISAMMMRNTIMTEKIARRGVATPSEYAADPLDHVQVGEIASAPVVSLRATQLVGEVQDWIATGGEGSTHQGFPVVNDAGDLVGVLTRRDIVAADNRDASLLARITRPPYYVYEENTVRQAADLMVRYDIGRLPVLGGASRRSVTGFVTRSDVLSSYRERLTDQDTEAATKPALFNWREE